MKLIPSQTVEESANRLTCTKVKLDGAKSIGEYIAIIMRTIEFQFAKGFGMFSTSKNCSYSRRRKKAKFWEEYPFPMLAAELFALEMFCLGEEYFYPLRF